MKINEIKTLTIEDVAFGGAGVAREENQVVFIPYTLPGETVKARLTEDKKNYFLAELIEIEKASPKRQPPSCPYFGQCQGCSYQHTDFENQLKLKVKQVQDLLQRIGKIKMIPEIKAVGSDSPFHFRNKIKMHVKKSGSGWKVGFIGKDNRSIVDIEECAIAQAGINHRLKHLREEVAKETEDFEGVWIARTNSEGKQKDFFFEKGENHKEELPLIMEKVLKKKFLTPFDSFFQTNHEMLSKLIEETQNLLKFDADSLFIDAYCGVGLFSLLFADKFKRVIGIDEDPRAIGCAKQNVKVGHIKNARFLCAKVEDQLKESAAQNQQSPITLLLDPPRSGCQKKVLETVLSSKIRHIVYISCNPSSLARDLAQLTQKGYILENLTLVDMFPQTAHIEVIAGLTKP